ncbi:RidA family protein [Komagataeibacter xylinus]|uniref:RidA family protein n=1 Tax=Komagataeibacter xylinus TaxID=28448 RepID=UPI000FDF8F0D|nr:RidA family protein [Komagataeibacter xylinus]AZV38115.1 hypothetical protein CXP35_04130 [Komagataeibacter xylinus]
MTDVQYIDQNARRSRAVIAGNTVYLAGCTAADRSRDAAGQTAQILETIEGVLAQAGTDKGHIVNVTIWLSDMKNFDAMNGVYDNWIVKGRAPARCCGEVRLALPDVLVEIMVVAVKP